MLIPAIRRNFYCIAPQLFQLIIFPCFLRENMNDQLAEIQYNPAGLIIGHVPLTEIQGVYEFFKFPCQGTAMYARIPCRDDEKIKIAVYVPQVHDDGIGGLLLIENPGACA